MSASRSDRAPPRAAEATASDGCRDVHRVSYQSGDLDALLATGDANVAAERQRAQRLASARQKERQGIKDVLKDFDRSRSGGLTFEELRAWLVKLDTSRENHPTDLEVKWVIQMATPEVQEFQGEWTSGKRQLTGEALKTACEHWMMYLETYDEIAAAVAKYDKDHTDTLS